MFLKTKPKKNKGKIAIEAFIFEKVVLALKQIFGWKKKNTLKNITQALKRIRFDFAERIRESCT